VAAALLPGIRAVGQLKVGRAAQPGLSTDGTLAASLWTDDKSQQAGVLLTDIATRRELGVWQNEGIAGTAFALNHEGSLLASAGFADGRIALWNLREGKRIASLDWPRIPSLGDKPIAPVFLVSSEMTFCPESRYFLAVCRSAVPEGVDSEQLAAVLDKSDPRTPRATSIPSFGEMIQTVLLWDIEGSTEPRTLATTIHDSRYRSAVFASKGKWLVFPLSAETIRVYDLLADQVLTDINLPVTLIGKPAIDGSGQRLVCPCSGSAAGQGTILIWDLAKNVEESRLKTDFSLASCVPAFSPDGNQLALGTKSGRVVLLDLLREREVIRLKTAHTGMVGLLRWDPDGRHLNSWGMQAGFKRWELGDRPLSSFRTGQVAFNFALSPDGQWLACGGGPDGKIQLFDRTTGSIVRTLTGYRFPLPGLLAFSPKGRTLAQIGAYQVVMWNVTTGQETGRLEETSGLPGRIESVAFTDDETALVSVISTRGPRVSVWDVRHRREIWQSGDKNVRWACLSPDGRRLFGFSQEGSTGKNRMTVCEIPDGRTILQAEVLGVPFGSQTFSPNGQWLVKLDSPESRPDAAFAAFAASTTEQAESGLALLSLPGADQKLRIAGPTRPTACAFSPDSRVLAVGYQDGSAKLWDLEQREDVFCADFCSSPISQLAFTPDGAALAVTDGRSPIQLLHLTTLRQQLADIGLSW
jgi:WD40 repeat protein